jgi:hypothetical protein
LRENPQIGVPISEGFYKIRMAISGKNTGKSGGARVITYHAEDKENTNELVIHLIAIYDKSETPNISVHELRELLNYD